ncbi:MAG: hypothetical protein IH999_04500 [Proteobacteria bacterium]|nr:hypothetical protein [Pseudomonadota bacterium]
MNNQEWDLVHNVAKLRVTGFPNEQIMGIEVITWKGENVLLAMSGEGLIDLRDQINDQFDRTPEIASWKSQPEH